LTSVAIIQARCSSSRLPGKVLKPILGLPMLQHQIMRTQRALLLDKIIVATSDTPEDNEIELLCNAIGIGCYRGSLLDVLDRFYQGAKRYKATTIVRLTGDCPLIDPQIIDKVIQLHFSKNTDYTSNCNKITLPDGLDVEVFTFEALKKSWQNAVKPSEREHVTQYIRNHTEIFSSSDYLYPHDISDYRWTVDEVEDFEFVSKIYHALYSSNAFFNTQDILSLLEKQPQLLQINSKINRNEGLVKSISREKELGYE